MQIRPLLMKISKKIQIHILTIGGILEFPILNDVLLRRVGVPVNQKNLPRTLPVESVVG